MKHYPSPFSLTSHCRWLFWSVLLFSGGGMAIVSWLEDEAITVTKYTSLVVLPDMTALLYWFNHLVFKAIQPSREYLSDKTNQRKKHL